MAIALSSSGSQPTPALDVTINATIAVDNYVVAVYVSDALTTTSPSYGSPLSEITKIQTSADNQMAYYASGKATAGASSLTSSTFPDQNIGALGVFSGVDTTTPFDVTFSSGSHQASTNASVSSTSTLTITTATAGAMVLAMYGWDDGTTDPTITIDDGGAGLSWSQVTAYQSGGFRKCGFFYATKPTAGALSIFLNGSPAGGYSFVVIALRASSGSGPTINTQPASAQIPDQTRVQVSVTATTSGGALSYQWQDNRSGSFANTTDGDNPTSATYTTPALYLSQSPRQYRCVVTDANGSVNSNSATITVAPTDFRPELTRKRRIVGGITQLNDVRGWWG